MEWSKPSSANQRFSLGEWFSVDQREMMRVCKTLSRNQISQLDETLAEAEEIITSHNSKSQQALNRDAHNTENDEQGEDGPKKGEAPAESGELGETQENQENKPDVLDEMEQLLDETGNQ